MGIEAKVTEMLGSLSGLESLSRACNQGKTVLSLLSYIINK